MQWDESMVHEVTHRRKSPQHISALHTSFYTTPPIPDAGANPMASSSRAASMKARPNDDYSRTDYRDNESISRHSSHRSKRQRSTESSARYRSKAEEDGRIGRDHHREPEGRRHHRSRSRESRSGHHERDRESHEKAEKPGRTVHSEFDKRSHHHQHHSDRHRESRDQSHRDYYERDDSYRSVRRKHSSRSRDRHDHREYHHSSEHHRHRHRTTEHDTRRESSHLHHKGESFRKRDSLSDRHTRRKDEAATGRAEYQSSRSSSPDSDTELSASDRFPKSSRRSSKQKSQTLERFQARKPTQDYSQDSSVSPDRDRSYKPGLRSPRRSPESRHNQRSRDASPSHSKLDSLNVPTAKERSSSMNPASHAPRRGPGPIDTRQHYAAHPSQYGTPNHSHHNSPHSASPYGRPGWGGGYYAQQQHSMNAYSPHRQHSYPGPQHADQHYYQNSHYHAQGQQAYGQPYHATSQNNSHNYSDDRRYSGSQISPVNPNDGSAQTSSNHQGQAQSSTTSIPPSAKPSTTDDDNPFRPPKNLRAEDEGPVTIPTSDTTVEQGNSANTTGPSKVSFAFKTKPAVTPSKPVPDLSQKIKETKKENVMETSKPKPPPEAPTAPTADREAPKETPREPPPPATKEPPREPKRREPPHEPYRESYGHPRDGGYYDRERHERQYDERYREERYYDQGYRGNPRDYYDNSRDYRRDVREHRDARPDWHGEKPEYRDERFAGRRHPEYNRRWDNENPPPRFKDRQLNRVEAKPEVMIVKKKMTRIIPRPTLSEEHAQSTSVYFRKPGNESVIGAGTYGKVFKAVQVYTKEEVALKKIRMEGERDGFPVTAVREVKLLQSLHHPNIVRLLEVMVENHDCYMVFEYASHDLTGLLFHPNFILTAAHKKHLIKQLFEGLDYLHRRGVLHRDIKAANILVTNRGELKLADFGLARFYKKHKVQDYTNRVITIWYRPPELLLGETQYGPAVDIWSAACVMMEVFSKHAIFPGDGHEINQLEKIYNILGTPTLEEWPGMKDLAWYDFLRPISKKPNVFLEKFGEKLSPQALDLMQALFVYDPKKRPIAEYVLKHPYFTTEEPEPAQAVELSDLQGDWHEFESKQLRRKRDQHNRDSRSRQATDDQHKRKAVAVEPPLEVGPDSKKAKSSTREEAERDKPMTTR